MENQPCDKYYQSQLWGPDFSFLNLNFRKKAIFSWKIRHVIDYQSQLWGADFIFMSFQKEYFYWCISELECQKKGIFSYKISPVITIINRNFEVQILAFWARIFWMKAIFFMKNQPCDTIINPKFWVQFSGFLAFKSNIFTIFESSNFRKNAIFLTKNQPCDTIINPKFWVQFLAFWARIFWMKVIFSWFKKV